MFLAVARSALGQSRPNLAARAMQRNLRNLKASPPGTTSAAHHPVFGGYEVRRAQSREAPLLNACWPWQIAIGQTGDLQRQMCSSLACLSWVKRRNTRSEHI